MTQQHLQRQAMPVIPHEEPHRDKSGCNNNNASPQNQGRNKEDDESNKGQGRK